LFLTAGAKRIPLTNTPFAHYNNSLYILPRTYDGTATGETCAIIGVSKRLINNLFEEENAMYELFKSHPDLVNVPGIEDLQPYKLFAFKCMLKFLYFLQDHELILFNIEPKGNIQTERRYPCANLCLPGGGMEIKDEYCWEKCAMREFTEETGLVPDEFKLITKQRFTFTDRQSMYFWYKIKSFKQSDPPAEETTST
jgi:hypothetical protein